MDIFYSLLRTYFQHYRPFYAWRQHWLAVFLGTTVTLSACSTADEPVASASGVTPPTANASQTTFSQQAISSAAPPIFDAAPTPELPVSAVATPIPPAVRAALERAKIQPSQVSLLVTPVNGGTPLVNFQTGQAMNPASVIKLITTAAALDLLGAAYTWHTPVWADGSLRDGTLRGNLYIRGQGDPKLVVERLWLLLRQIRQAGVRNIDGDLVLDNSAFDLPAHDAGAFDGEPLRPYNAAPDALLVNFKSLTLNFTPDIGQGIAHVDIVPPLAGVLVSKNLPLSDSDNGCHSWQNALKGNFNDNRAITFSGSYPASCGTRSWTLAYTAPAEYAARAIAGMWLELGGAIKGQVRFAPVPQSIQQRPALAEVISPPVSEIIRDINKYSNNVMANQLFLTLGLQMSGTGSYESANTAVMQWWRSRLGETPAPLLVNGSGLSRVSRISASSLGAMLQTMWQSPSMPEFISSMPIAGIDGTLRRSRIRQAGSSHLKTGTLEDASALAGYVLANSGQHYVLVAIANGANAPAARPAFEALVDWTMQLPNETIAPINTHQ